MLSFAIFPPILSPQCINIQYLSELSSLLDVANDHDDDAADNTTSFFGTGGRGILGAADAVLPFEIGLDTISSNSMDLGGASTNSAAVGKKFILSAYNQDVKSGMYRSPWSNSYFPCNNKSKMESEKKIGVKIASEVSGGVTLPHNSNNNRLRSLEVYANEMFDIYRSLYYGKGKVGEEESICSAYLWEGGDGRNGHNNENTTKEDGGDIDAGSSGEDRMKLGSRESLPGFGGCILIQNWVNDNDINNINSQNEESVTAYWNSIHELTVSVTKATDVGESVAMGKNKGDKQISSNRTRRSSATYEITSTILLSITSSMSPTAAADAGITTPTPTTKHEVCGSLTRHTVRECNHDGDIYDHSHIQNIGKYIEEIESHMRSELDTLYLSRLQTNIVELMMGKEKVCPLDVEGRGRTTSATMLEGSGSTTDYAKVLSEAVLARAMSTRRGQQND